MASRKTNTGDEGKSGLLSSNLGKRVAVAFVFIPVFIFITYSGGILFFVFVELLILLSLLEFYDIAKAKGLKPLTKFGTLLGLLLGVSVFISDTNQVSVFLILSLSLFFPALFLMFDSAAKDQLINLAVTFFGILYCGWLFSHQIMLRNLSVIKGENDSFGWKIIFYVFILTWILDTAAYFVGTKFGRRKLYPRISPGKTVEGAISGMVVTILSALLLQYAFFKELSFLDALALGILISIVGQLGDLIESMFKRDARIKDSSSIIPGHGGVLDRFDAIMFTVPVTYYYLIYLR